MVRGTRLPMSSTRRRFSSGSMLLAALLTAGPAPAQDARPAISGPYGESVVGLTLPDALRLALLANLDIAQAQQVVVQARAAQLRAQAATLPSATLGANYTNHQGTIQRTEGN